MTNAAFLEERENVGQAVHHESWNFEVSLRDAHRAVELLEDWKLLDDENVVQTHTNVFVAFNDQAADEVQQTLTHFGCEFWCDVK